MIITTPASALLPAPAPVHSSSGDGNAPLWLVIPFMVVVAGVLLVRFLRRR